MGQWTARRGFSRGSKKARRTHVFRGSLPACYLLPTLPKLAAGACLLVLVRACHRSSPPTVARDSRGGALILCIPRSPCVLSRSFNRPRVPRVSYLPIPILLRFLRRLPPPQLPTSTSAQGRHIRRESPRSGRSITLRRSSPPRGPWDTHSLSLFS